MEVDNRDYHYLSQNEIGGRRGFDSNPDWNVLRFLQYCVDRLCGVKSPIAEVVNGLKYGFYLRYSPSTGPDLADLLDPMARRSHDNAAPAQR
jgi:hypothetical protein